MLKATFYILRLCNLSHSAVSNFTIPKLQHISILQSLLPKLLDFESPKVVIILVEDSNTLH